MTSIVMPGINLADALRRSGHRVVIIGDGLTAMPNPIVFDAKRWWVWALAIGG